MNSYRPLVLAHRGDRSRNEENTSESFRSAVAAGADGIETDVQRTLDGVLVLYHNRTLLKAGGGRQGVHTLNYADLQLLNKKGKTSLKCHGVLFPKLGDILKKYIPLTSLLLEIKKRGGSKQSLQQKQLATEVARLAASYKNAHLHILCFHPELLQVVNEAEPQLSCILNIKHPRYLKQKRFYSARVEGYGVPVQSLNKQFAETCTKQRKKVFTYTCNAPHQFSKAWNLRVTGIITDYPERLIKWLDQKQDAS